jgi:hypothetical protein
MLSDNPSYSEEVWSVSRALASDAAEQLHRRVDAVELDNHQLREQASEHASILTNVMTEQDGTRTRLGYIHETLALALRSIETIRIDSQHNWTLMGSYMEGTRSAGERLTYLVCVAIIIGLVGFVTLGLKVW